MNVLMVSTSYPGNQQDWRGRFIFDMAESLAGRHDLSLALWTPPGELPSGARSALSGDDADFLRRLLEEGGAAHLLRKKNFGSLLRVFDLLRRLRRIYRSPWQDVVHVNWLQNALPLWGTHTPALVTVLGSDYGLLDTPGMGAMLRTVFRQRPVVLAPNASWMVPRLEKDFGDVAKVAAIPFGVSRRWFEVERREGEHLGWIAVTRLTATKLGDLFRWGEGVFGPLRPLHLFGPRQEKVELPPWVVWHGPTHPAELRGTWFPSATGLITLSRHDEGRPQVVLEAMAAGLPVVASDLSAHRDVVRHGETGYLVSSAQDFRTAVERLEAPEHNRSTGEAARNWVRAAVGTWDDCAARYEAAYRDLLGGRA